MGDMRAAIAEGEDARKMRSRLAIKASQARQQVYLDGELAKDR
jgi:hypothetical protein